MIHSEYYIPLIRVLLLAVCMYISEKGLPGARWAGTVRRDG